jgi:hypothetical protein
MINNKRILKTGVLAAAMTIVFAIFAFRAAEWTKGLDSEFLVYGASTGSSTGTTNTGGGTTVTKVIPQIAAGNYGDVEPRKYGTIIEIVNANSTPITVSGNLYTETGGPSTLVATTNLTSLLPTFTGSFNNLTLAQGAILVIEVGTNITNTPISPTTNWGKFTASGAVTVASFFELRDSGSNALYSRVGVPASRPDMTTFVIPRVRQASSGVGIAEIDAGFALVNTGTLAASVTATIYDANGARVGQQKVIPLAPGAHIANFASYLFALTGEATARQYQYILFQSSSPSIAAAGLAFEGASQTSFPVDVLQ